MWGDEDNGDSEDGYDSKGEDGNFTDDTFEESIERWILKDYWKGELSAWLLKKLRNESLTHRWNRDFEKLVNAKYIRNGPVWRFFEARLTVETFKEFMPWLVDKHDGGEEDVWLCPWSSQGL